LINCHSRATGKREFRIAPVATKVATGGANEHTRKARITRLTLNALVYLGYLHICTDGILF